MRFNFAPTAGFESQVGNRTDLRMMAEVFVPSNRSEASVVLHRYYAAFLRKQDIIANSQYSVVELTAWPLIRIGLGQKLHFPSSGMAGIIFMLKTCASVSLYGFDINSSAPGHYYDDSTDGLTAAMKSLVATEPWRLKLAPNSLRIPRGTLKVTKKVANDGSKTFVVSETMDGAYTRYINQNYRKSYENPKRSAHNFMLERNAIRDLVTAGCVQSSP
jgi:hypothetical protein